MKTYAPLHPPFPLENDSRACETTKEAYEAARLHHAWV